MEPTWKLLYIPEGIYADIRTTFGYPPEAYLIRLLRILNTQDMAASAWGLPNNKPFSREEFEVIYD